MPTISAAGLPPCCAGGERSLPRFARAWAISHALA